MLYLPAEFPQEADLCYLNHAAVAPLPKCSAEAVQGFAFENMTCGAEHYPRWMQVTQELRERLRWLINASSAEDIALVKNTSEGLSFVASGLQWHTGDEIVGIADDFPSNRVVWESLQSQGVKFVQVDTNAASDPESALLEQFTERTRLLAISTVHFATGVRLDIDRLSRACRERGVLLCLDAIQSLGAIHFDLQQTPADFVVADGHKWMLGAEGLGLFYVNPAIRDRLKLTQFGWAMREQASDYTPSPWQPAHSARRFECGTPNMLGIHALHASLGLLQEVGMQAVEEKVHANADFLLEALDTLADVEIRTPGTRERRAGIVSFSVHNRDPDRLWKQLMKSRVICASRGGYLRFSAHFYTRKTMMKMAIDILSQIIQDNN